MRTLLVLLAALFLALGLGPAHADQQAPNDLPRSEWALRARELTLGLDFEEARRELAAGDPNAPDIVLEKGRLALYEADCDGAVALLGGPTVTKTDEGEALYEIARGCERVTAAIVTDRDDTHHVEVRYQDEHDRALTPLIVDTVVKAREALTRDLGVTWPRPTRIIVVRDLLSLSAMTGLPYEAAQTTGTVAVAKWGRVTLLSPRASRHGYSWRDTIAHELTHLAVTRATRDRAPLWLQEGIAKREETRWRAPGPFDDRPSPDTVVVHGMNRKLDLPLDKLGPSIAMLPSADAAMVAFAEVTSFVHYYAANAGDGALRALLEALREGKDPDAALEKVSGDGLKGWDARWRNYLATKPHEALPPVFGWGEPAGSKTAVKKDNPAASGEADPREARDRVRLAELLLARGHAKEALQELDRLGPAALRTGDPSLRALRGRALEAVEKFEEAEQLVSDPNDVVASYGPWWALRGRLARTRGDEATAESSFVEGVAADPFDVESACEGLTERASPKDRAAQPLCDAARAWRELATD